MAAVALVALGMAPARAQWIPSGDPDPAAAPQTTLYLSNFGLPEDTPAFILNQFPNGLDVKQAIASSGTFTESLDLSGLGAGFPWEVVVSYGSVVNAVTTGLGDTVTTGTMPTVFQIGGTLSASIVGPGGGSGISDNGMASSHFVYVLRTGVIEATQNSAIRMTGSGSSLALVNEGLVTGNAFGIQAGNADVSVSIFNTETGQIRATGGTGVAIAAGGMLAIENQGIITGNTGILGNGNANTIVNYGRITSNAGPAINLTNAIGNNSLYNTGVIQADGVSNGALNAATAIVVNGSGTLVNDGGTITGGVNSAAILGGAGALTINNINRGTISAGGGNAATAIQGGAGTDIVNVDSWSTINGQFNGGNGSDAYNINLVGVSPRVAANLRAAAASPTGSVTVRGNTYSWASVENVTFNTVSFEQWGRTPNQQSVGAALDSLSITPTQEVQTAYDNLAAAGAGAFPSAANALSPQRYEAANLIAVTQSMFRYRNLQRRYDNIFNGQDRLNQVDTTGLVVRDGSMNARMSDANIRLASLSLSSRVMSDVSGSALGGFEKNFYEPKDMVPALFPPEIPDLEMEPEHHWGLWVSGTGIFADGDGNQDISGFDYDAAGAMVGADYRVLPQLSVGLFAGYDYTGADLDNIGSSMEVNSATVGTYAAWSYEGWHADGTFAYSFDDYKNERRIVFPGTNVTANSKPSGDHYTVAGGFGYDFTFGKTWDEEFRIGPMASIQYTNVTVDGFSENSAGPFGLNVSQQNADSLRSQLGGRFTYVARLRKATLMPHLYAGWVHEFFEDPYTINASFQQPGVQSFGVTTSGTGRDFALVGGGIDCLFFDYLTAFLDYDAQVGQEDFFAQEVTGGVRFDF